DDAQLVLPAGLWAPVQVPAEHAGHERGKFGAVGLQEEAAGVLIDLQPEQGEFRGGARFAPALGVAGEAPNEPGGAHARAPVALLPLAVLPKRLRAPLRFECNAGDTL